MLPGIIVLINPSGANQDQRCLGSSELISPWTKWPPLWQTTILMHFLVNENDQILIRISLTFVPWRPIDSKPALFQVMTWHWTGDKLLSEPMPTQFTDAYICGIRKRWVNSAACDSIWHHRTWETLIQIMAHCLMAPSHCLSQHWLIISEILCSSSEAISQEMIKMIDP